MDPTQPRTHPIEQALILLYLAGLGALVLRTHILRDDRWGLCMFRDLSVFQLEYRWTTPQGTITVPTQGNLFDDARMIRAGADRDTVMGIQSLRTEITPYLRWLWENKRPDDATRVSATLRWRTWDRGVWTDERFTWPR